MELDVPSLRRRILRDPLCSEVLSAYSDVFLVGGYLRDLLIKSIHSKDIDFIASDNIRSIVNYISSTLGGRVVELRKERMLRVVLAGGRTIDFSRIQGDIKEDLCGRDFTINAMAWSPDAGLIDPTGGMRDIEKGLIRAVSSRNLENDPVRLLRAYRFAAELGMKISGATRGQIKQLCRKIRESASERITLEFFKLLNSKNPLKALGEALSDGVLTQIIPLSINKLRNNIKSISSLDNIVKKAHLKYILKEFSQGLSYMGLLRLEILMLGTDPEKALFALSTDIRRRLKDTGRLFKDFKRINKVNKYSMFELFLSAGESASDLLLLAGKTDFLADLKRFERIQARGLIGADEIMATTGIRSGPRLGRVIRDLKRLQFAGELRNKRAARRWLDSR